MNARILLAAVVVLVVAAIAVLLVPTPDGPAGIEAGNGGSTSSGFEVVDADLVGDEPTAENAIVAQDGARAARRRSIDRARASADEEAELPTGPTLKGRVVDQLGRGVPDAEIEMRVPLRDQGLVGLLIEDKLTKQATTSDGLGYFELIGLPGKTVEFTVGADGFGPLSGREVELPTDFTMPIADLVVPTGVVLHGTVLDAAGRAIEGAELTVSNPDGRDFDMRSFLDAEPDAVSDAEGRFELKRVALGKWRIEARAFERPMRSVEGEALDPGRILQGVIIELPEGGSIAGTVKGLAPERYAEFTVEASPTGTTNFFDRQSLTRPTSPIDEDGRFEIRGLDREREYDVKLAPVDSGLMAFAGFTGTRSDPVTVKPHDVEIEVLYTPGAALRFQVVDATTSEPVERYSARFGQMGNVTFLRRPDGEERLEHPQGRGEFPDLYESDAPFWSDEGWRLEIDAPGYEAWSKGEITVVDGVDIDLGQIELMPSGQLAVTVLDASDGDPINSAIVRLTRLIERDGEERNTWRGMDVLSAPVKKTKTDADGRATLDGFGSDPAELVVSRSRYADFVKRVVMGEDDLELEILLSAEAQVTCEARDVNGNELGGVTVEHMAPDDEEVTATKEASSRGSARFRGLTAGAHRFRVEARRDGEENPWTSVTVGPGTRTDVVVIGPPRGRVVGRITEAGRPLTGALVEVQRASDDGEQRWERRGGRFVTRDSAETDGNGFYEVNDLEYGDYVVVVQHDLRAMSDQEAVTLDRAEVRVDMALNVCGVQGVVVDKEGSPIVGATVVARPVEGTLVATVPWANFGDDDEPVRVANGPGPITDAAGVYELRGLSAGTPLILVVNHPHARGGASEELTLAPDEMRTDVRIEVELAAALEVRLRGNTEGVFEIEATHTSGTSRTSYSWGGSGDADFSSLEGGTWTIEVRRGSFGRDRDDDEEPEVLATREVELVPGRTEKADIDV